MVSVRHQVVAALLFLHRYQLVAKKSFYHIIQLVDSGWSIHHKLESWCYSSSRSIFWYYLSRPSIKKEKEKKTHTQRNWTGEQFQKCLLMVFSSSSPSLQAWDLLSSRMLPQTKLTGSIRWSSLWWMKKLRWRLLLVQENLRLTRRTTHRPKLFMYWFSSRRIWQQSSVQTKLE